MNGSVSAVRNKATSRKIAQSCSTVQSVGQEDTYQQNVLPSNRLTGQPTKDTNFEKKKGSRTMKLTEKNGREHRINCSSPIKTDVSTVPAITKPVMAL